MKSGRTVGPRLTLSPSSGSNVQNESDDSIVKPPTVRNGHLFSLRISASPTSPDQAALCVSAFLQRVSTFALYSAPAEIIPVGIRPPESGSRRKVWSTDLSDHNWSHDDPCSILRWPHSPSPACNARRPMRSFPRFGDHKGVTFGRGSTVAACSPMS